MRSLLCLTSVLSCASRLTVGNESPVIGILTQETYWSSYRDYEPPCRSFIAASSVKSVEASGGRMVPVFTNKTTDYYEKIVKKINGVIIPGGGSPADSSFGICKSTNEIFNIAKRINNADDRFPLLGICLGLQLLTIASIDGRNPLKECDTKNISLPLTVIPETVDKSMLFETMPDDIKKILLTEPVTFNNHGECVTPEDFTSMQLDNIWNPITINNDRNNLTFISTIEAKHYPFVGLQFHPEINAYEWKRSDPHSWSAIYSARYFFDWFMNECRQNKHRYSNKTELENELIYNYPKTYVGKSNHLLEEVYFFKE